MVSNFPLRRGSQPGLLLRASSGLPRGPLLLDGLVQVHGGRQGEAVSSRRSFGGHYAGEGS